MNAIYILCHFNREKRREKMTDKHLKPLLLFMLLCSSAAFAYGQVTYYHNDALGSPIAASDSEGKILWRESYQPYGERQQHEPRANANRRWFTSHVEDADTGLLYMQARYYDPKIGRFMSMDPVGFVEENPMSFNRYAYANNNPYKYVDPDGGAPRLTDLDEIAPNRLSRKERLRQHLKGNIEPLKMSPNNLLGGGKHKVTKGAPIGGSPALKGDAYHPDTVAARQTDNRKLYGGFDPKGAAKNLGYGNRIAPQKVPFNSHGQPVFSNGKGYISPDVDGHNITNGWKRFDRKGRRTGTWNTDLTKRLKE